MPVGWEESLDGLCRRIGAGESGVAAEGIGLESWRQCVLLRFFEYEPMKEGAPLRRKGRLERAAMQVLRWVLFTLLALALALDVAVGAVVVVVIVTLIASIGRVVEQHASSAILHGLDQVDGEVGIVLEALTIRLHVSVAVGVHDLACSNARHEAPEWRALRAIAIDFVNLFRIRDQFCLVEAFAILVHGHVFQLRHVEAVAQQIELVAADGIVVLLVRVRKVGDVVKLALVEPLDQQFKAGRIMVR